MIEDEGPNAGAALRQVSQELHAVDDAAQRVSRSVGHGLRDALDRAIRGGTQFGDVLRSMASTMARAGLRAAITPITAAVGQGTERLMGGLFSGLVSHVGKGVGGAVKTFARGGVVERPTGFAMTNGSGLMGEAGPEAILPLARGADGRLGVRGGSGMHVTLNLSTPDAESFQRTRSQVTASLARAMSRASRRL